MDYTNTLLSGAGLSWCGFYGNHDVVKRLFFFDSFSSSLQFLKPSPLDASPLYLGMLSVSNGAQIAAIMNEFRRFRAAVYREHA